ncbi:LiaI-LiaF-like domain-containing protein [Thalassobacillus hwangdonensis]|uniref:LiaI-LiaF-like domain-containing protein n=1 Tax=Thalassobacillus hwangdonensis TaxID=546108 RepID=A0ABW3KYH7_9BACI
MKKQNSFLGFVLIGIGAYFLLRQLHIPLLTDFYSWPTLLMVIGVAFLLHSYIAKEYQNIFTGALLLGLGIHFHASVRFVIWPDHWGMYLIIIGIAFLLRYQKTRNGLFPGLILGGLGIFAIFSSTNPGWFYWIHQLFAIIEKFWPLVLIVIGFYFLKKKN